MVNVQSAGAAALINGTISVNGTNGVGGSGAGGNGGGGGSGGSVFIQAPIIAGTGTVSALGGHGGNDGDGVSGGGGGGAGGRINFCYSNLYNYSGSVNVSGGTYGSGGTNGLVGGTGTFYTCSANGPPTSTSTPTKTPTPTITLTPTITPTTNSTSTPTPVPNSTPCSQSLIFDSGGTDTASAIALDSSGNVYVGGTCPSGAFTEFRIVKYDTNGNTLWNTTCFPVTTVGLNGLTIDSSGNVFAVGYQQFSTGRYYLTLKLNSAGVSQWAKTYDGTGGAHDNDGFGAAVDPTNTYVYVTGRSYTNSNWDMMTLKYDMNGVLQGGWPVKYDSGGNHDQAFAIAGDPSGNIYIGGESDLSGVSHGRIIKYNSAGASQWNITYNSGNYDQFNGLAVDPTGTYVYANGYSSNGTHNIGRLIQFGTAAGGVSFNVTYNNAVTAIGDGVAVDGQGNIYTVLQDTSGKYHTVKYGPNGSIQWDQTFTRGLGVDQSNAVAVGGVSGSDVYVTGQSSNGSNNDFMTIKYQFNSNCPYTYTYTVTPTATVTPTPSSTPTAYCPVGFSSAVSIFSSSNAVTLTNVTVGGVNPLLLVQINYQSPAQAVTSVSYGSSPLSLIVNENTTNPDDMQVWALANPPLGSANVTIKMNASEQTYAGAVVYNGFKESAPLTNFIFSYNSGNTSSASVNLTTLSQNSQIVNFFAMQGGSSSNPVLGGGQIQRWHNAQSIGIAEGDDYAAASPGSYTMTYSSLGGSPGAVIALEVQAAGCAANTPTITQTPTPTVNVCFGLDTANFNNPNGYVTKVGAAGGSTGDVAYGMKLDSSGNIVACGYSMTSLSNPAMSLYRFTSAGAPDLSFAGSGYVFKANTVGGNLDYGKNLAIDSNGNIYVAGYAQRAGGDDMVVWSYTSSGSVNTNFNGNGFVTITGSAGGSSDWGSDVLVDGNGNIVVAGYSLNTSSILDMEIWRFLPNGTLDAGNFGATGAQSFSMGTTNIYGYGMCLDANGNILVTGRTYLGGNSSLVLWRVLPNGNADPSFGGGSGVTMYGPYPSGGNQGSGVKVDSAGHILVTGTIYDGTNSNMCVIRFLPNGSIDNTFGGGGLYTCNNAGGVVGANTGNSIALDASGRIVVTGNSVKLGGATNMTVWRLNPNGSPDTGLNGTGYISLPSLLSFDTGWSTALDSSGRVLVAGQKDVTTACAGVWRFSDSCPAPYTFTPTPSITYTSTATPTITPSQTSTPTATFAPFSSSLFYFYNVNSTNPNAPTQLMGNPFGVNSNAITAVSLGMGTTLLGSWASEALAGPTIPAGNWDFALTGYESLSASGCAYFHVKVYDYSPSGPTTNLLVDSVCPTSLSNAANSTVFWSASVTQITLPYRDKLYTEVYVDKTCGLVSNCVFQYGGNPGYSRFDAPGYGTGASAKFGDRSVIAAPVTFALNTNANQTSMRFTAPSNSTLSAVQFNMLSVSGSPGYKVSIQGDAAGIPNGYLAPPTNFTPVAGWNNIALGTSVAVTTGGSYHVVVEWDGISALGINTASVLQGTAPDSGYIPLNQAFYGTLGVAQNTGGGWQAISLMPVFLVNLGGNWFGNPLAEASPAVIYQNNYLAQRFRVTGAPLTIASVAAFVNQVGAAVPSDNLYWEIRNAGATVALPGGSGTLAAAQTMTSVDWLGTLIPTLVLPTGNYEFVLKSPLSTNASYFQWISQDPASTISPYLDTTYDGVNAYCETSTNSGTSFSPLSASLNNDFGFEFLEGISSLATYTPSITPTLTPSQTPTQTPTFSQTQTPTFTQTQTPTFTQTQTPTFTQTATPSFTQTQTPTFTQTQTPTFTQTQTSTFTQTQTPTFTQTQTPTFTQTQTPTFTQTRTPTFTQTQTPTFTQTQTPTFTQTQTPTFSQTATSTFTQTQTPTFTQTQTSTFTQTQTPTFTQTQTPTFSQTQTPTFTQTATPTTTATQTTTFTQTASPSQTTIFTSTLTATFTTTVTPTFTQTQTPTFTQTQTTTFTQSATPTYTQTKTPTLTPTQTPTNTQTQTPTLTQTQTPTITQTQTPTFTQTQTPTLTQTQTPTLTQTQTPTFSQTQTPTLTQTQTLTFTPTKTSTLTPTTTSTVTSTTTPTLTSTITTTFTATYTPTSSSTATFTLTSTSSPTVTNTITTTFSPTFTSTVTSTNTPTSTSTVTFTTTSTQTRTYTSTVTETNTPTFTPTWTSTSTPTNTYTVTSTKTSTSTPTAVFTNTLTPTASFSPTATYTFTPLPTSTWTLTPTISYTPTITLSPTPTGSVTDTPTPDVPMYLSDNYFNPVTGATLGIDVLVAQSGEVKVIVFNMLGEEVDKLVDQSLNPGSYHFSWDGRNRYGDRVGNGVYLVVIEQSSGNFIRKVIVLK